MNNKSKVVIIGSGFVGASSAFSLMQSSLSLEIVLIDSNFEKANGDAVDIMHGEAFLGSSEIYAGDYSACANCDLIIITAGANQKPGETRIDLLNRNLRIFKSIISSINEYRKCEPVVLIVTNPVDILTYYTYKMIGLPKNKVIGSGTVLDSSRFRYLLSEHTGIDAKSIHAYIVGEHGDSSVAVWSRTNIAGMRFDEYCKSCCDCEKNIKDIISGKVKNAAYEIIEQKGATYYAIALAVRRITESILRDEHSIMTISSIFEGEYGIYGTALSMPSVVGSSGIERLLPIEFDKDEKTAFDASAEKLKKESAVIDEFLEI